MFCNALCSCVICSGVIFSRVGAVAFLLPILLFLLCFKRGGMAVRQLGEKMVETSSETSRKFHCSESAQQMKVRDAKKSSSASPLHTDNSPTHKHSQCIP